MKKISLNILLYILICITGLLFIVRIVNIWPKSTVKLLPPANSGGTLNSMSIRERISMSMHKDGAENTYAKLKNELLERNFSEQHRVAHIFGELLFETEGLKGITVCDDNFSFGCYHSFFGMAIARSGIGQVKELDNECVQRYRSLGLGCPHGIGHGLGEYLGPTKLMSQLEACATLSWQGTLFGCQGGVFMEYNFPVSVGTDSAGITTRSFDPHNPYDPCPSVPTRFRRACYLELTTWWQDVLHGDYGLMGSFCDGLTNFLEREDCFRGIGYSAIPKFSYRIEDAQRICHQMPTRDTEVLCRAGGAWSLFANPSHQNEAIRMCEGLSPRFNLECRKKYDLLGTGIAL